MSKHLGFGKRLNASQHIEQFRLVVWQGEYLPEDATDAHSLYEAFRLRHQVFAEMKQWEEENADRLEIDEFDQKAQHFMLVGIDAHKQEHVLAYTRLIKGNPTPKTPENQSDYNLPMQKADVNLKKFHKDIHEGRFLELSRLVANPVLRNTLRKIDNMSIRSSDVLLYLTLEYCLNSPEPAEKIIVILEDFMCRRLDFFGIIYERIGQPVEHKGTRYPIMIDPHSEQNIRARSKIGQLLRRETHGTMDVFSEAPTKERLGRHTRHSRLPKFPRRMAVQQVFKVDIGIND